MIFFRLAPHGFRLRLNTRNAVETSDRTVENAQGTLHLNGKVDVTRRVDDVEPVIVPEASGRGRRERAAATLLLLHPINRGGPIVDFHAHVGFDGLIKYT